MNYGNFYHGDMYQDMVEGEYGEEESGEFFEVSENFEPTQEQIYNFAAMMGIDILKEQNLLYLAREALMLPPPEPWMLISTQEGELFYLQQDPYTQQELVAREPPNLEELVLKVENKRKKNRTMAKKNRNQGGNKNALNKILGRNLHIQEEEEVNNQQKKIKEEGKEEEEKCLY